MNIWRSPSGLVVNRVACNIAVSKFKLHVHLWFNNLEKCINPPPPHTPPPNPNQQCVKSIKTEVTFSKREFKKKK